MHLRTTRTNHRQYVQLVHNYWDPKSRQSRSRILCHFGPRDELDLDALRRLIQSLARYLPPEEGARLSGETGVSFEFLGARKLGGPWVLEGLWRQLGIDRALGRLLEQRGYQAPVERLLFALVANRCLAPSSKLAMEHWVPQEAWIPGLPEVEVHQLYRAMDFLLEAHDEVQRELFFAVANLFNPSAPLRAGLEVDVLFFDTTTSYFEIEGEEEDPEGLRKRGYNKDHRPDLAQVVIGFAVTRDGIPVRCWVWPGNTADQNVVEEVKRDLNTWKLGRVLVVLDTGFNSAENRRVLRGAGDAYIAGEKLRLGSDGKPPAVLSRAGRFRWLEDGPSAGSGQALGVKVVVVERGTAGERRFVIVHNPEEAERDRQKREEIAAEVERRLRALGDLGGEPHTRAACDLRSHPVFGRYVRQTRNGGLALNQRKLCTEEKLDGKFLLSTNESQLSAEEVARGYKELWRVERVHRDLKHTVDIRPTYHRLEDRIRAHVLLCWLGLVLIRLAEQRTGWSWHHLCLALDALQVGHHRVQEGEVWQTTLLTAELKELLTLLQVKPPNRYLGISPGYPTTA